MKNTILKLAVGLAIASIGFAQQQVGNIVFTGGTSGTTTVQASAAASGTLTLPAATDTLTGKATTDIFTNKTFDTAGTGNVFKINGTQVTAITGAGAVFSSGAAVAAGAGSGGASYGVTSPIILSVKSVTVLTAGAPADIATITIPAGITRFTLENSTSTNGLSGMIAETEAGTLTTSVFQFWTGAAGTGTAIWGAATGPATASPTKVGLLANANNALFTTSTIHIYQTVASLNAGTMSFYFVILPVQ